MEAPNHDINPVGLIEKRSIKRRCLEYFGWPYTKLELLAVAVFLSAGISHCLIFQSHLKREIVKDDTKRYPIFDILSILTPIFGFYSALALKINQGIWVNLSILFILIVCPLIVLIILIAEKLFIQNLRLSIACIFIPVSLIGLSLFKIIRKTIISDIGRRSGEILMIIVNILCNMLFNLAISVILLDAGALSDPKVLIQYLAVVYLAILTLVWIMIHLKVYKKRPNEIQDLRMEVLSSSELSMRVQVILTNHPDILETPPESFFSKHGHNLASLGILISLICVETGLISVVSEYNSGEYPESALLLSIFYIFAIPVFLFGGTIFSSSGLITTDKFLVTLICFAFLPTILIMWLSYYLYTYDSLYYIGIVIGVGFPGTLVYWVSMSMIFEFNKRSFQYFSSIFCLIFIVPVSLIIPLYYSGGMKFITFWATEGILLFAGLIILVLWLVQLLFKTQKEIFILYKELSSFHNGDLALYIYSFCFLLGYAAVAWAMFKKIDTKNDWNAGLLAGCFVILGLLIVDTLFLHRVKLYIKQDSVPEESIGQILQMKEGERTLEQEQSLTKKKKVQILFIIYGLIISLSIGIPLLAAGNSNPAESSGITVIVGGVSGVLIFTFLIELKHFLKKFGETVISYILGYCWLFCFIPIIVFIPITLSSTDSSSEQRSVTSWSIGSILLLFMIGVSIVSITLNYLFHKLEYEKIAKLCCKQVQEMLTQNGVRANLINLRGIFDNFYNSSPEAVKKVLVAKTVYSYRVLDDKEPDLEYSKEILTLRELNKLKSGQTGDQSLEKKKGLNLISYIRRLCGKKEPVPSELSPEELGGVKIQIHDEISTLYPQTPSILPDENWEAKFKNDAKKLEEAQKGLENNVKIKAELGFNQPEILSVDKIPAVRLSKIKKTVIMQSKELDYLLNNDEIKKSWLMAVFARFSSGMIGQDGEPWMNLSDLRNLVRLSGLAKVINNAACDILYVSITRRYNSGTGEITPTKINFDEFCNRLIPELAGMAKLKVRKEEVQNSLIKQQLYPHLSTNLPWLQLMPDESISEESVAIHKRERYSLKVPPGSILVSDQNKPADLVSNHSFIILNPKTFITEIEETNKKVFCSNCLDKFSNCSLRLFKVLIGCCGKIFDVGTDIMRPVKEEKKIELFEEKDELVERRESPEWEEICNLTVGKFEEVYKEVCKGQSQKTLYITLNLANYIGIFGHITEIYSFSSVAFYDQVGWVYGSSFTTASSVILADSKYWVEMYWICFSASLLFLLLMYPTLKLLKQGRLGLNPDFTIAKFPSPNFFLTKFIGLFGKSMYLTIMCSLLSAFSCVYESNSWHLMRYSSIECFSTDHIPYFIISIFTLLFYYPAATLLYPNLAYQDKALDIKFDTTYLVLESQGKVLIAAFAVFFAKEKYVWLQLIVSIIVSILLFLVCLKLRPCLITSYNLWKTGGFLIPVWACSCALINFYTFYNVLAMTLLIVGFVIIVVVIFVLQWKIYGFKGAKVSTVLAVNNSSSAFEESEKKEFDVSAISKQDDEKKNSILDLDN